MFKKTKVILTKIWFFFLIFFFASWTPLHLAAAVIDIVFSLTFFFQKSMLKKDNYSVCLNVAIFKNKQKKIPTNLISFIFWFIANPQWNKILWNLVLWLDIKKSWWYNKSSYLNLKSTVILVVFSLLFQPCSTFLTYSSFDWILFEIVFCSLNFPDLHLKIIFLVWVIFYCVQKKRIF